MYCRNNYPHSRNSSKSYKSTSPSSHFSAKTIRIPSQTIAMQNSPSSSHIIPISLMMHDSQAALSNLKSLLSNEQQIKDQYKQWCQQMCTKISTIFEHTKANLINLLSQVQNNLRCEIQRDYIGFVATMRQLKDEIRSVYNEKIQFQRFYQTEKAIQTKRRKIDHIDDYYGKNQNKNLIRNMYKQNEEREDFKELNQFYHYHQGRLEDLNQKVIDKLQVQGQLASKQSEVESEMREFERKIEDISRNMRSAFKNLLLLRNK